MHGIFTKGKFTQLIRTWKLRDPAIAKEYNAAFKKIITAVATGMPESDLEDVWCKLKTTLRDAAFEACGFSKNHQWKR